MLTMLLANTLLTVQNPNKYSINLFQFMLTNYEYFINIMAVSANPLSKPFNPLYLRLKVIFLRFTEV